MHLKLHATTWRFSYAITKYYPWRWFTPFIAIFSLFVLVILTLINVAANGYETVDMLSTDIDYGKTHSLWWSAFFGLQQTCDPRQLMSGDSFQTTNGAFQYTVGQTEAVLFLPSETVIEPSDGWFYSDESLASLCSGYTSPELSVARLPSFNLTVDRSQSSVNAEVLYNCRSSNTNELALMELKMTYRISLIDGLSYTAMVSESSSIADFLPFVLDWLAIDMLVSVINATSMVSFHVDATVYCPTDQPGQLTEQEYNQCMDNPPLLNITDGRALYNNGSIAKVVNGLTPALNQSVSNFLPAILAASQADMGIWQNNSFFVNLDMLNATISPADAVSAAISTKPDLRAYYDPYDSFIIPGAQNIRIQPFSSPEHPLPVSGPEAIQFSPQLPFANASLTPFTIATPYVCHMQRLKSPFSLIVSIIVADASEFTALWGIMMLVATYFAKKYDRNNYNAINPDDQLQGIDEEMSLGSHSPDIRIEDIGLNTLSDDRSPGPHSIDKA